MPLKIKAHKAAQKFVHLEIKNLGFSGQINQMGSAVQGHIREKL
jgi:hypothetical protein